MNSIIFTYYSDAVSHSFLSNVESLLRHGEKYDVLIICSDLEIPKKIVSKLVETIEVRRVLPSQITKSIRKRHDRLVPWHINPAIMSAFSYSGANNITVFDPNLFVIKPLEKFTTDSYFFKNHNGSISSSLFKFKYSAPLEKAASEILSKIDFQAQSSELMFSQFTTQCMPFGTRSFSTKGFIFCKPKDHDKFIDEKIFAIDFTSTVKSSHFKALNLIKEREHIKKPKLLARIKKSIHEFIDLVNVSPAKFLDGVSQPQLINQNLAKYAGVKPTNTQIKLIYTKQVANHAKNLEKILGGFGFKVTAQLRAPGNLDPADQDLHIVMCPNVFGNYPQNYIAYQFEQAHSSWFSPAYLKVLNNSIEIWEYSKYNIGYFKDSFEKPHVFVPIGTVDTDFNINSANRDIDVLFYGEFQRSQRRRDFLEQIKQLRKIHIVDGFANEKFSSEIVNLLKRTKVVLNHHYYDNGNLEVVRLYEAMSYGCRVVSENSVDDAFHNLPITRYSTVDEANQLIANELDNYSPLNFKFDQTPYIKAALLRLGFDFGPVNRTIIFAHYDLKNQIDQYVIDYINELYKHSNNIIFVSDSDLDETEINKIRHLVLAHRCKKHGEANDFGSFKRGFEILQTEYPEIFNETTDLIFANDSTYCVNSLKPMLDSMKATAFDAWSAIDHAPDRSLISGLTYMQTNFMVFSPIVFQNPNFLKFWKSIDRVKNKSEIVKKYELALSELLAEEGFSVGCYVNSNTLNSYIRSNSEKISAKILSILATNHHRLNSSIFNRLFNMPVRSEEHTSELQSH